MKLTANNLRLCMELAERIGTVTEAHMYDAHFISVEGAAGDGSKFTVTVNVKEENKDD